MSKSNRFYLCLGIFSIILYCVVLTAHESFVNNSDAMFLWNRITQLVTCLKDGNYPFFYYNDFAGVGYGSSIFYGQLTLLPFIPFALCGREEFTMMYFLVTCTINYLGVCCLAKRFVKDYLAIALLYLTSPLFFCLMLQTCMYSCYLAIGLGFFFVSYCIDFFRDNKSFYKAVLLFILIFNTHLITTLICFCICVSIFIYYFDKNNIKEYFKFCVSCIVISLYNVCNYLSHLGCLKDISDVGLDFENSIFKFFTLSRFPFIELMFYDFDNIAFMGTSLFVFWIFIFFRYKISLKERIIHIVALLGVVLGINFIWTAINDFISIPIQFPLRYLPFLLGIILILIVRRLNSDIAKFILILFSFISFSITCFSVKFENHEGGIIAKYAIYIGNGEYVSSNFLYDTETFKLYSKNVLGDDGTKYDYKIDKNKLVVDLSNNTSSVISVPKLYYYGYVAKTSDGSYLNSYEGYSMFTHIDVKDFSGELTVYYKQPDWLVLLLILDYAFGILLIIQIIRKR